MAAGAGQAPVMSAEQKRRQGEAYVKNILEVYRDNLRDRGIPEGEDTEYLIGKMADFYGKELEKDLRGEPNQLHTDPNFDTIEKLGPGFIRGMDQTLAGCGHADVRDVYTRYGNQLQVGDPKHKGGAFYRFGDGVFMDTAQTAKGNMIHTPYQTAFHEFGHNIDYILGGGSPISESWGGGALQAAIRKDFEALKGSRSNEELIEALKERARNEGWTIRDTGSASDIIESLTGISYPLGVGHGKDYWDGRLPCKEFFAETLDGAAANGGSYAVMQTLFPHAVEVVHRIIGGSI